MDDAERQAGSLRDGIRAYLRAMHQAYLAAGGGRRAAPDDGDSEDDGATLADAPFTVAVVAARSLHLIATREHLDAPSGDADTDAAGPLAWRTVFLDASVLPALDDIPSGPDEISAVRAATGITATLYHLAAGPGAALTPHHATHTGTGLAHRELAGR